MRCRVRTLAALLLALLACACTPAAAGAATSVYQFDSALYHDDISVLTDDGETNVLSFQKVGGTLEVTENGPGVALTASGACSKVDSDTASCPWVPDQENVFADVGDGNDFVDARQIAVASVFTLQGRAGNDFLFGTPAGYNHLYGGGGDDWLEGGSERDNIYGDFENGDSKKDWESGCPAPCPTGNDSLIGHGARDELWGWLGDDTMIGGEGPDDHKGGSGKDTVDYSDPVHEAAGSGVTVGVDSWPQDGHATVDKGVHWGEDRWDLIVDTERVIGTRFADDIQGSWSPVWGTGTWTPSSDRYPYTFEGRGGNDNLSGRDGPDVLLGGDGADTLEGRGGDDQLRPGAGGGTLTGGDGADTLDWSERTGATLVDLRWGTSGTTGNGGAGDNATLTGIENVKTGSGADHVLVSARAENVRTGAGDDIVEGSGGADDVDTGAGTDTYDGSTSSVGVSIRGGALCYCADKYAGLERLYGGAHADQLWAPPDADGIVVTGGNGNDDIRGSDGNDDLEGGAGNDWITRASYGADTLDGGPDDDRLDGGPENDVIAGGSGVDGVDYSMRSPIAPAGPSDDISGVRVTLDGTADDGNSIEDRDRGDAPVWDAVGTDVENVYGSAGDDVLIGSPSSNELDGMGGDDRLNGGVDNCTGGGIFTCIRDADVLTGNAGNDTAVYSDRTVRVAVRLDGLANDGTSVGNAAETDNVTTENVEAGTGADTLVGDNFANRLAGGAGGDAITGAGGPDTLLGGAGTETVLDAGGGDDHVESRDTAAEAVNCGDGLDTATADVADSRTSCESETVGTGPTAAFGWSPAAPKTGDAITFSSTSTDPDPGGVQSQAWDLDDDGAFDDGSGLTVTHSFSTDGAKPVRLRVVDAQGNAATTNRTVTVANRAPGGDITWTPSTPHSGDPITFTGTGSDPDGTVTARAWDLDDDGDFDDGAAATATRAFPAPGPRTVRVRLTDDDGADAVVTKTVTVANRAPAAGIGLSPVVPHPGQPAILRATATDADGAISQVTWDLDGDGAYDDGDGETTARRYPAGSHTVGVRVIDDRGSAATATKTFTSRGGGGQIVYARDGSLHVVRADGTGGRQIDVAVAHADAPALAPDGERIVFSALKQAGDARRQLFVARLDGSELRQLTGSGSYGAANPAWAPDGASVAYTRTYDAERREVWRLRLECDRAPCDARVSDGGAFADDPAWSPDARRVVYTAREAFGTDVWRLYIARHTGRCRAQHPFLDAAADRDFCADHTQLTAGTATGVRDQAPAWSPDGRTIVFSSARGASPGLWAVAADEEEVATLGLTRLADTAGARDRGPAFSPDGSEIAFHRENRDGSELAVVRLSDSAVRRVAGPFGDALVTAAWGQSPPPAATPDDPPAPPKPVRPPSLPPRADCAGTSCVVPVSCPTGSARCTGTMSDATPRASAAKAMPVFKPVQFSVAAGRAAKVKLKLTSHGRAMLRKRGKLAVKVRISYRAGDVKRTTTRKIVLRARR